MSAVRRPAWAVLLAVVFATLTLASGAAAQGTNVPFGGFSHDSSLPVEITADNLSVDQANGLATFAGNVVVGQGSLRLAAERIEVTYGGSGTGEVREMKASGGVTLSNGAEAAEAAEAVYTVADGAVLMQGDVLLSQGQNAISGQRLRIDLNAGTAQMEGRVKTIFQPESQ
ncbi:lipopolysaccharide transport periplasmic protein LptA [Algicella marina]|uniref:Lipopolysaccharide transport periplasmic protein LptA n=1 Tax=Algicella marina TaxID=2683284 RepID=A0A6P1T6G3_9RHOB|nr:lipopolysaccharide transport periplasmic protein LptA [Algicella marina]QHQ36849.1 lipopolysaccharide transport periplasmic protein LptA [Algicella marina]